MDITEVDMTVEQYQQFREMTKVTNPDVVCPEPVIGEKITIDMPYPAPNSRVPAVQFVINIK